MSEKKELPSEAQTSKESDDEDEQPKGPVENAWAISIPPFNKGDMKYNLQEQSKFEVTFPKYREKYIKECWPLLTKLMEDYGIKADLNLLEGTMSVATTRTTWDPFLILKARDIIRLLGRSVPLEHAVKVLKDNITCEIMKIKNLVRNRERLTKRRQRLIGSNGTALKTLELLTECYILVQGCTVSAIGPHKGVQQVMKVVLDTMKNVHPINLLKVLMVKRALAKDPDKKNEDWSKYLPSYTSTNVKRKKPKKIRQKKPYTQFPPERTERIEDKNMQSGKYFVEMEEKEKKNSYSKLDPKKEISAKKQKEKRSKAFVAPQEPSYSSQTVGTTAKAKDLDVQKLKRKLKKAKTQ